MTLEIDVPVGPAAVMTKSEASTPVTGSLKVTAKSTVAALVGLASVRTIEVTTGSGFWIV